MVKAADELNYSTNELQGLKNSKADDKKINGAIEKVHTNYQKFEALFA